MLEIPPKTPPPSGSLDDVPLAELVVHVARPGFSGSLEITSGGRTHVVSVAGGLVVKVRLEALAELLGRILVDAGVLTQERVNEALALQAADRRLLGRILVEARWVEPETLEEALREQVRRRLHRLFLLGEGTYLVNEGRDSLVGWGGDGVAVDPLQVLPAGIRSASSAADIEERCVRALDGRTATAVIGPEIERLGLSEAERGACRFLARGQWDAGIFASVPAAHRSALGVAACCLIVTGHVLAETRAQAQVEPAPPLRPSAPPPPLFPQTAAPPSPPPRNSLVPEAEPAPTAGPGDGRDGELRAEVEDLFENIARRDHFEILGLPRTATAEDAKARYLDLVKRYHPDRAVRQGLGDLRGKLDEILLRLKEAIETLADPAARERYVGQSSVDTTAEDAARAVVEAAVAAENAYQMALVSERQRRLDDAERYAAEAVRLVPGQAEYVCMGVWIAVCKRPAEAKVDDLVTEMVENAALAPKLERVQMQAARLLQRAGRSRDAAEYFRRVVALNAYNVDAARELRLLDMRGGRGKESGGLLSRLLGKKGR